MAQAVPLIGLGISAISTGMSAYGSYQSGQQAKYIGQLNSNLTMSDMVNELESSQSDYSILSGRQRSLYGKAGVKLDSGSPLLIYAHTFMQNAKEQLNIKKRREQEAKIYREGGTAAARAGNILGTSTLLAGIGRGVIDAYSYSKSSSNKVSTTDANNTQSEG
jgi:hypothetical protein